jgi:predicted MFS family arabinose efflux permease
MVLNGLGATQIASRLMPYVQTRLLVVPGLVMAAIGVYLLTSLTPTAPYATHVLPTEVLVGLGLGIALVPCISTATSKSDPNDVGVTSAMTTTAQQIGASIGTALLNTIAASTTAAYLVLHGQAGNLVAKATVHGYATASAWAAGILLLAAVLGGLLIDVHPGQLHRGEGTPAPLEL